MSDILSNTNKPMSTMQAKKFAYKEKVKSFYEPDLMLTKTPPQNFSRVDIGF